MLTTPRSAHANATVPFLPGYETHKPKLDGYKRSHVLSSDVGGAVATAKSDIPQLNLSLLEKLKDPSHRFNHATPSISHEVREAMKESARNTYRPDISPAWLQHDRQVLRFYAYFQEPVHEDPRENFRVRHCIIYFYLEDGTMMISEPKIENSGIAQGAFVKRHRIPKPTRTSQTEGIDSFYTFKDLRVDTSLKIYSRVFRIVDCDEYTRQFYVERLGETLAAGQVSPPDSFSLAKERETEQMVSPVSKDIKENKEYNELSLGGNRKNAKYQQYLENDRKVLMFNCYWDDPTRYGSRSYFTLHYYLMDDTVEILENHARNSGRDAYPVFWRRAVLRKNPHISPAPGMIEPEPEIFTPIDFVVGEDVNVYGRRIRLYDCDTFTRDFYRRYCGLEQGQEEISGPEPRHVKLSYPPHTGFGTEEDSLASCLRLTARPPRRDVRKLMSEDNNILRFEARIVGAKKADEERRFILAVHTADDNVSVWEARQRNSGHTEGKFAQKSRKRNPATDTWFEPADFFIGAVVEVNSTPFELLKADEVTLKYMEDRPGEFPFADVDLITNKLAGLRDVHPRFEELPVEELQQLALVKLGVVLNAHELVTLQRMGRARGSSGCGDVSYAPRTVQEVPTGLC